VESNGSRKQIATLNIENATPCATCSGNISVMTASAHLLAIYEPYYETMYVVSTSSGVMTLEGRYPISLATGSLISIQIDQSEQWMYVNYSSTGGSVADTALVYSMRQLPSSLVYVTSLPLGVGGIQIVP